MKTTDYKSCRHYDRKSTIKCMIPDLCPERGIEHCPYRTRWSQGIRESDHDFWEWCLNHPIDGDALFRTTRDTPPNEAQIRGVR